MSAVVLASSDRRASQVSQDLLVPADRSDAEERWVSQDLLDVLACVVVVDRLVTVCQEIRESVVSLAAQAELPFWTPALQLPCPDLREMRDQEDLEVWLDPKDPPDPQDPQGLVLGLMELFWQRKVKRVRRASLEEMAMMVDQEERDPRVRMVTLVSADPPDPLDPQACPTLDHSAAVMARWLSGDRPDQRDPSDLKERGAHVDQLASESRDLAADRDRLVSQDHPDLQAWELPDPLDPPEHQESLERAPEVGGTVTEDPQDPQDLRDPQGLSVEWEVAARRPSSALEVLWELAAAGVLWSTRT